MARQRGRACTLGAFVSLTLGAACGRAPREQAEPAPSSRSALSAAAVTRLQIEQPHHDFGTVVQGEVVEHAFELSNVGTLPLEFEPSTEALGCVGSVEPKILPAGKHGRLAVTCQTEFFGPLRVTLPLWHDISNIAEAQVELTSEVTPRLSFDTPLVDLKLPFGEVRSLDVYLVGALRADARLELKDAGKAGFEVRPFPATADHAAGLHLRVKGKKVGTTVGNIVLVTHLTLPAELSLPYSCKVEGSLDVSPTTPYFDLSAPGPKRQVVSVHSSQAGFAVRAVRVLEGPFAATFERGPREGQYQITIVVQDDKIWEQARSALGRILILSNDRTEPQKELPLFGFGALHRGKAP